MSLVFWGMECKLGWWGLVPMIACSTWIVSSLAWHCGGPHVYLLPPSSAIQMCHAPNILVDFLRRAFWWDGEAFCCRMLHCEREILCRSDIAHPRCGYAATLYYFLQVAMDQRERISLSILELGFSNILRTKFRIKHGSRRLAS